MVNVIITIHGNKIIREIYSNNIDLQISMTVNLSIVVNKRNNIRIQIYMVINDNENKYDTTEN